MTMSTAQKKKLNHKAAINSLMIMETHQKRRRNRRTFRLERSMILRMKRKTWTTSQWIPIAHDSHMSRIRLWASTQIWINRNDVRRTTLISRVLWRTWSVINFTNWCSSYLLKIRLILKKMAAFRIAMQLRTWSYLLRVRRDLRRTRRLSFLLINPLNCSSLRAWINFQLISARSSNFTSRPSELTISYCFKKVKSLLKTWSISISRSLRK